MFTEAFEDILRDHCTPALVRAIEAGGSPAPLWDAIAEAGFLELLAPETAGGAALGLADLFPILHALGRHAMPLPIGETLVARALLPADAVPGGMVTLAPAARALEGGGWRCPNVPFGAIADHVVADAGDAQVLLFDCAGARRHRAGIGRSLVASLEFGADAAPRRFALAGGGAGAGDPGGGVRVFAAALYAALLAGALARTFEITLQYGNDRVQFGKPIGRFQAIQHQLAVMAELVAASRVAAEAAFQGGGAMPAPMAAALAKARASDAVSACAGIAHAVHGAIGVTQEYDLQLHTRRLHEWRLAHGSEDHWHGVIGQAVIASGQPLADFVRTATH
ncbi:MAG: acyl-CoA dehydrogenase [Variovorax sp.]|nr:MAG: acyl-CoA dehydrogenase [Variovorax sp.]